MASNQNATQLLLASLNLYLQQLIHHGLFYKAFNISISGFEENIFKALIIRITII